MERNEKPINEYLDLICSLIIDQVNVRYEHFSLEDFKAEANKRYVERDWVYKIGEYFKDLAYYEVQDNKNNQSHHDIFIPSKDFIIEIKYLKNWNSAFKTQTASKAWVEFEKDFQWLEGELINGNKKKRAFVLIWCNCLDYFGQVMQLGMGRGVRNPVNKERLVYFPFLMNNKTNLNEILTRDLVYNYRKIFPCQLDLNTIGKGNVDMDCLFLGGQNDRLHIAIYF
ncbi:MAG: hypothetical protein IJ224_03650 [Lachnospiraceae bacterium]|nr:hypothetical protein [Lachnospiraceae bacterium]